MQGTANDQGLMRQKAASRSKRTQRRCWENFHVGSVAWILKKVQETAVGIFDDFCIGSGRRAWFSQKNSAPENDPWGACEGRFLGTRC